MPSYPWDSVRYHVRHTVLEAETLLRLWRAQRILESCMIDRHAAVDDRLTCLGNNIAVVQGELLEDEHLVLRHIGVEVPLVSRVVLEEDDAHGVTLGWDSAAEHLLNNHILRGHGVRVKHSQRVKLNGSLHGIFSAPEVDVLVGGHLASLHLSQLLFDFLVDDVLVVGAELRLTDWEV